MSKTKWTPGDWLARQDPNSLNPDDYVIGVDGYPIDGVAVCSKRDARLISAAPELYAALDALYRVTKNIADSGDCGFWDLEDLDAGKLALAAMAKARGES